LELEALQNPELGALTTVVVLSDVPEGTPNLSAYFDAGQPLELLVEVIAMKERAAGGNRQEIDWMPMTRTLDLPTITPAAFSSYYSFNETTINISPAGQNTDIRIYGKFKPAPIVTGDSPIVPNTSPILAFGAAALVAMSRGNEAMVNMYESKRLAGQQSFICDAIMNQQHIRTRMLSWSGRGNKRR
jgi:hypothetical protein